MKRTIIFLSAILAGLCVSFGGMAFLSLENRVMGAAAFTIGLFVICTFGFHLFTGKVCYALQNDRSYALNLPLIWIGNLIGTGLGAGCAGLTRVGPALREKAAALCQVKLNDGLLSLFLLGLLCNIFIYIAVEGYRSHPEIIALRRNQGAATQDARRTNRAIAPAACPAERLVLMMRMIGLTARSNKATADSLIVIANTIPQISLAVP